MGGRKRHSMFWNTDDTSLQAAREQAQGGGGTQQSSARPAPYAPLPVKQFGFDEGGLAKDPQPSTSPEGKDSTAQPLGGHGLRGKKERRGSMLTAGGKGSPLQGPNFRPAPTVPEAGALSNIPEASDSPEGNSSFSPHKQPSFHKTPGKRQPRLTVQTVNEMKEPVSTEDLRSAAAHKRAGRQTQMYIARELPNAKPQKSFKETQEVSLKNLSRTSLSRLLLENMSSPERNASPADDAQAARTGPEEQQDAARRAAHGQRRKSVLAPVPQRSSQIQLAPGSDPKAKQPEAKEGSRRESQKSIFTRKSRKSIPRKTIFKPPAKDGDGEAQQGLLPAEVMAPWKQDVDDLEEAQEYQEEYLAWRKEVWDKQAWRSRTLRAVVKKVLLVVSIVKKFKWAGAGRVEKRYNAIAKHTEARTREDLQLIEELLTGVRYFQGMTRSQLETLSRSVRYQTVIKNEVLYTEEDTTSEFFVIEAGSVVLTRRSKGELENAVGYGVHLVAEHLPGESFAEEEIFDLGKKCSCTAKASEASSLFAINQATFKSCLEGMRNKQMARVVEDLRRMPIFRCLQGSKQGEDAIFVLARACIERQVPPGTVVVKQGTHSDTRFFYGIKSGTVRVVRKVRLPSEEAAQDIVQHPEGFVHCVSPFPNTGPPHSFVKNNIRPISREEYSRIQVKLEERFDPAFPLSPGGKSPQRSAEAVADAEDADEERGAFLGHLQKHRKINSILVKKEERARAAPRRLGSVVLKQGFIKAAEAKAQAKAALQEEGRPSSDPQKEVNLEIDMLTQGRYFIRNDVAMDLSSASVASLVTCSETTVYVLNKWDFLRTMVQFGRRKGDPLKEATSLVKTYTNDAALLWEWREGEEWARYKKRVLDETLQLRRPRADHPQASAPTAQDLPNLDGLGPGGTFNISLHPRHWKELAPIQTARLPPPPPTAPRLSSSRSAISERKHSPNSFIHTFINSKYQRPLVMKRPPPLRLSNNKKHAPLEMFISPGDSHTVSYNLLHVSHSEPYLSTGGPGKGRGDSFLDMDDGLFDDDDDDDSFSGLEAETSFPGLYNKFQSVPGTFHPSRSNRTESPSHYY